MNSRDHVTTEILADHAEGLLGESETGLVEAHLSECADCRETAALLASLQEILAADDPGPMPAHYAARIDAELAELAIAEPVRPPVAPVPVPLAAPSAGAQVIDLASRRQVMVTALRRLSTVAAGVVLLIGGAALGVETLGNHDRSTSGALEPPAGVQEPPVVTFSVFPSAPKGSTKGPHGTQVGPDGTIYGDDKVFLPDGTVVLAPKTKGGSPTVVRPVHSASPAAVAGSGSPARSANPSAAAKPRAAAADPAQPAPAADANAALQDPASPDLAPGTMAGPPERPPAAPDKAMTTPDRPVVAPDTVVAPDKAAPASDKASAPPRRVTAQQESRPAVIIQGDDPYVSESGTAYTEDNFAGKVMDLMRDAAAEHRQAPGSGSFRPGSQSVPVTDTPNDPAAPNQGPTPRTYGSELPQSAAVAFARPAVEKSTPARGPASTEVQALVRRCAAEIPAPALAGDEGTWLDRKATIVIVPSDNHEQVVGYVFYGDCTTKGPAPAATAVSDIQWQQRVNKPTAEQPATTKSKRLGDITRSEVSQRNTHEVEGDMSSPSPAVSVGAASAGTEPVAARAAVARPGAGTSRP